MPVPFTEIIHSPHFDAFYLKAKATTPLQNYILGYWETRCLQDNNDQRMEKLLPSSGYSLILHHGAPYQIILDGKKIIVDKDILLTRAVNSGKIISASTQLFGIDFRLDCFGLYKWGNSLPSVLTIEEISENSITKYINALKTTHGFACKSKAADEMLIPLIGGLPNTKKHQLVAVASNIRDISEAVAASPSSFTDSFMNGLHMLKTIRQMYRYNTGINPFHYWRLYRLRNSLEQYADRRTLFDAKSFGYEDHRHFCKDCLSLTGMSVVDLLYTEAIF